jgi:hypothetical protein
MNLHPGVVKAFKRMGADELGIAELMASGDLPSPQRYLNVTLFDIRITGTGVSYRPTLDEYVFRRPEDYLTERFLKRCQGLQVIMNHPEKTLLNGDEFEARSVGSVMIPYIKGDDVWAIVKIYDDEAIDLLLSEQMSTSPAVLLDKDSFKTKIKLKDGAEVSLLVEGKVKLLDHIAICKKGVWDKGGEPEGIEQSNLRGDSVMAEDKVEDKKEDSAAKADDAVAKTMDMCLKGITDAMGKLDSLSGRMDAWDDEKKDAAAKADAAKADAAKADAAKADAAKKDAEDDEEEEDAPAERLAADKKKKDAAKKDAEEEEGKPGEDDEKADAARADAVEVRNLYRKLADQSKRLAELTDLVSKPLPDGLRKDLITAQSRADEVFTKFGAGMQAKPFMAGESVMDYRRRLAGELQKHSKKWEKLNLAKVDDEFFGTVETDIYADSVLAANSPQGMQPGRMTARTRDEGGHKITEYFGNDVHFTDAFTRAPRRIARIKDGRPAI